MQKSPLRGTHCKDCDVRGHYCPALVFAGDVPLCRECRDGEPCVAVRRGAVGLADADHPHSFHATAVGVVKERVRRGASMRRPRGPKRYSYRTPELVNAVLARPNMKSSELARELQVPVQFVYRVRSDRRRKYASRADLAAK